MYVYVDVACLCICCYPWYHVYLDVCNTCDHAAWLEGSTLGLERVLLVARWPVGVGPSLA